MLLGEWFLQVDIGRVVICGRLMEEVIAYGGGHELLRGGYGSWRSLCSMVSVVIL